MKISWTLSCVSAALLVACSTTRLSNLHIDEAHRVYGRAAASADVMRYAPVELARARDALASADQAWREQWDSDRLDHLSYIATRRAELAISLASQRAADTRIMAAGALRAEAQARDAKAQAAEQ